MRPAYLRALVAPAALVIAIALAGCDANDVAPSGRALAPLSDKMIATLAEKNMDKESPILARIFKEDSEMEVWKKNRDGEFALLKTYPICRWSGDLGPKKREGERQAPEGFYTITPGQMNPKSNYYLAFNTGFPNAYDRAWGYTGSELMVHGDCSSRGCYAMTDEQIQEIYALARESFYGGQKEFQLQAFPFRMTALKMAKHRNNPNFAFWKMLKEGYDHFDATHQEPRVAVCEKRYVFDAAAPDDSRSLSFNAKGACPTYQLDKNLADAINDHQRQEQRKMAEYIASGVSTVASRAGVDGGMNPVFLAKLSPPSQFDNNGRVQMANVSANAPGALPRVTNAPGAMPRTATVTPPAASAEAPVRPEPAASGSEPAVVASVPMPRPAPQPKQGEAPQQPTTIAGLIGSWFSGSNTEAASSAPDKDFNSARSTAELPARPKQPAPVRTASAGASVPVHAVSTTAAPTPAPAAAPTAKTREAAPKPAASPAPPVWPSPPQPATQPAKSEPQPAQSSEIRTAYSTPPASNNGLLSGAQPVVPAGSFGSFR